MLLFCFLSFFVSNFYFLSLFVVVCRCCRVFLFFVLFLLLLLLFVVVVVAVVVVVVAKALGAWAARHQSEREENIRRFCD